MDDFLDINCNIYIYHGAAHLTDAMVARAENSSLPYIVSSVTGKRSPSARRHSLAAVLLMMYAAEKSFGLSADQLSVERTENGKPFFANAPDCCFNLSHSSGAAACITAPFPVGIDIEDRERKVDVSVMRRVCTQLELADIYSSPSPLTCFLRIWTLKESYIKATGDGLKFPMKNIEFRTGSEPVSANLPGLFFQTETDGMILAAAALIPNELPQFFVPKLTEVSPDLLLPYLG